LNYVVPEPEITDVRRAVMSRIKGANTKPETLLRKALWSLGVRYRLGTRIGRVRPDLVFKKARLAIFVDGCFWHGCPDHYTPPRSRARFWAKKLKENVERDIRQTFELERAGWRVLRIWEHQLEKDPLETAKAVHANLHGHESFVTEIEWRVISALPRDDMVELDMIALRGYETRQRMSRLLIIPKPNRGK
jgi:DNA mismatch endonuclease, patch repair protein